MLRGRGEERERLDQVLAGAGAGRSATLVLRGVAGSGKSALLAHAEAAAMLPLLKATGVVAESDLPFAALHQLLRPALPLLPDLPDPQHRALQGALGLGPAHGDDRFLVSAAVLSLLAAAAEPQGDRAGLLCVIDDAHWVDLPSLDALLFAARRLDAEGVVMLFAVRDGEAQDLRPSGLPVLDVGALGIEEASAVLAERAGRPVHRAVVARLVTLTNGNALALTELGGLLDADELSGRHPLPDPLPVSRDMEATFLTRVRTLVEPTQLALLVCAADGTGDLPTVLRAAGRLGVGPDALDAALASGLLTARGDSLHFRHPLVRSAIYGGAGWSQRRSVHLALAASLDGTGEADRRAGHEAAAAVGPDERVATALTASADRARARSGYAAAATTLQRAADLTPDPALRAGRLVAAAGDAWLGGRPDQSDACLTLAAELNIDPALADRIAHLRGRLEMRRGDATDAHHILLEGAELARHRSSRHAHAMLVEAAEAASYAGDIPGMLAAGRLAADIPTEADPESAFFQDCTVGFAAMIDGRPAEGAERLSRAIEHARAGNDPAALILASVALLYLGDSTAGVGLIRRAASAAKVADMVGTLPYTLEYLANYERIWGRYDTSQALSEEAIDLARDTGQETSMCMHWANLAVIASVRGNESETRRLAGLALDHALPRHLGLPAGHATAALAEMDIGMGRFAEGLSRLRELAASGAGRNHPTTTIYSMPDRIEAALRCGEREEARQAQEAFEHWTADTSSSPLRALMVRTSAMLAPDGAAEALFLQALSLYEPTGPPFERARTQLTYGEWLRRVRRPADARAQLRAAMEGFERLGAVPWAERSRRELRAAGESVAAPRAGSGFLAGLSPQELRIAQAVAAGGSNRDIAAQLFLSPRTVEYHLYKVYPKLGITSRTELVRLLTEAPETVAR